jgi:deoxyribodipyrimidine photo-lyase
VTDDFPAFIVPKMLTAAADQLGVRLEAVDANGLWPMRATDKACSTAHAFRREVQRQARRHLAAPPQIDPLDGLPPLPAPVLSADVLARWPTDTAAHIDGSTPLAGLPIDHAVPPVDTSGGAVAASRALERFLDDRLPDYGSKRNRVEDDATSGLSPYLHFGHISSWEVFSALMEREGWVGPLSEKPSGAREGWWGASAPAEAFLDQLTVWREVGFNTCVHRPRDYDRFDSLPDWALKTLGRHAGDQREHLYSLEQFSEGCTHDPLWNAAQGQLRVEGRIHNYLRMLWGKKILEWTTSPEEALEVMVELNNRFALDGRDPNSYSGIFWTLGRYDRPWAPERPIFGSVRYMSSENTARKMPVRNYIRRYATEGTVPSQPALRTD